MPARRLAPKIILCIGPLCRAGRGRAAVTRVAAMADDLWRMGARELAELIAKGEVSSREVVDAHLERIEAVNPAMNAVTVALTDSARAAADEADRAAGERGPLHGVP